MFVFLLFFSGQDIIMDFRLYTLSIITFIALKLSYASSEPSDPGKITCLVAVNRDIAPYRCIPSKGY